MSKLAIIGSAGRRDDAGRISPDLFYRMVEKAKNVIEVLVEEHGFITDCLVSGGAALADHIAVTLLETGYVSKLHLHLPAPWIGANAEYLCTSAGKTANYYHRQFSKRMGWLEFRSLVQLGSAIIHPGSRVEEYEGMWLRNTAVALDSDALLAMTFGEGARVKTGGTWDTVKKFLKAHPGAPTFHMDLNTGLCYRNIRI